MFNVNTGLILRGLLSQVIEFCKERQYSVEVDPVLVSTANLNQDEIQLFVDRLGFKSKGQPIQLRDYQVEAIWRGLNKRRMLCISPVSSGKSAIIAGISRYLQQIIEPDKKILIVVPNINLVNQFAYDLCDYFSEDIEWLKTDPIHTVFAGQDKSASSQIIISTWQSLYKLCQVDMMI
jgi:superfamily II DNA or RNA helicase